MMGREHAAILASLPLAELAVCCDVAPGAAEHVPEGVRFVASAEEALAVDGLEAVFVCTPQDTHRPLVEAALEQGLAVFCEKPLAHDLADADAIVECARRTGGVLAAGHMLRFDPRYLAVHEAVSAGEIGRVVSIAARRNVPDFEGRIIVGRTTLPVEVAIHDFDVIRWLAGEVERVYAEAAVTGVVGEGRVDAVVVTLRLVSGAVAVVETNWAMRAASGLPGDYRLAVVGSQGSAFVELRDEGVAVFADGASRFPRSSGLVDVHGAYTGSYRTEDEHFLGLLRGGPSWPLTPDDSRAALAVALAVDRSIAEGRPVVVAEM